MRNTKSKHSWEKTIFYNNNLSQNRVVYILEVIVFAVHFLSSTRDWSSIRKTSRSALWFRIISWIAACATTNFASLRRQFSHSYFFRHLTKTWFSNFREGFHTFSTASIFRIEFLIIWSRAPLVTFFHFRLVLWIFSSVHKIFNRASFASTCLTPFLPNLSPSLTHWDNTDTRLLAIFSMFAFSTTILISLFILSLIFTTARALRWAATTTHYDVNV